MIHVSQAESELVRQLQAAQLNSNRLDPWEAWKVFKAYLRTEVTGAFDSASVQLAHNVGELAGTVSVFFVRQFSERDPDGEDQPVRHVVVELRYEGFLGDDADLEVWTHDFSSLNEFAVVVEGMALFQWAINSPPVFTEVSSEEL